MTVNEYFDAVYVLNLDRRTDKWQSCQSRLNRENISAIRFPAIDKNILQNDYLTFKANYKTSLNRIGPYAILKSFIKLYRTIQENSKLKRVLIFEDDVLFHRQFNTLFDLSIQNIPKDWNMWHLGGTQQKLNAPLVVFNDYFSYANNLDGCFAMAINTEFIPNILEKLYTFELPADTAIKNTLQNDLNNKIFISTPVLCAHDFGYSDNWNIEFTEQYVEQNWQSRKFNTTLFW